MSITSSICRGQYETFDPWVDGGQGTGPKILVNVNNVTKYCGEDIIIRVGEIRTFEESLCEGDERPLEAQRAYPIVEGFEVRLPIGQIREGQLIDVCIEVTTNQKLGTSTIIEI